MAITIAQRALDPSSASIQAPPYPKGEMQLKGVNEYMLTTYESPVLDVAGAQEIDESEIAWPSAR